MSPASDEDLLARQSALQDAAREVLAGLELAALVADVGPGWVTGSVVSGLMCGRELDVMVLAGRDFPSQDVMGLLARIVQRAGVTRLEYRDERGPRYGSGQVRAERYHATLTARALAPLGADRPGAHSAHPPPDPYTLARSTPRTLNPRA